MTRPPGNQARRSNPAAKTAGWVSLVVLLLSGARLLRAQDLDQLAEQMRQLRSQNEQFQKQLLEQQRLIEQLSKKLSGLETAGQGRSNEMDRPVPEAKEPPVASGLLAAPFRSGNVLFSGEGGAGFVYESPPGEFHQAQFLLDEAKLFLDAKLWPDVYFFSEINLIAREQQTVDENLHLGELYIEFENVSKWWGQDRLVNLRFGRFYTPFGEEYQSRFVIDDPLVTHSITDIWGVDQGLELYGSKGPVNYVIAVQNGGQPLFNGFNTDKSVIGRLGYDPAGWLHLSASAMRTGALDPNQDELSALWFGNSFFRSIGSPGTTTFQANLVQGDVQLRWPWTEIKAYGGTALYRDNDPLADNSRDLYYYSFEAVQRLAEKLYAAARFGQIFAPKGYPIAGLGDFGEYFFNNGNLTTELVRVSLGLGYRFTPNLILKAEYALEWGRLASGADRETSRLAAMELGFKF